MPAKKGGKNKKNLLESEVKPMPALVFNNIRMTNDLPPTEAIDQLDTKIKAKKPQPKQNIRDKFVAEQLSRHNKMIYWFYAGMGIILIAIAFFWGYSLWSNFTSINWKKTDEKKIMEKTSTDFNQAFQTDKQNDLQNQLTKLQIKELLVQALKKQTATSTNFTTSTAPSTLTNTTTISTTTKN